MDKGGDDGEDDNVELFDHDWDAGRNDHKSSGGCYDDKADDEVVSMTIIDNDDNAGVVARPA
eukprot:scaffold420585_cov18-Prasinocladus_malaysianus.AAC.1